MIGLNTGRCNIVVTSSSKPSKLSTGCSSSKLNTRCCNIVGTSPGQLPPSDTAVALKERGMEDDLESEGDSESILSSSNPPKEAPPPLPLDLQNPPPEVFGPSETDEETGKPYPRTWWTRCGPSPPRRGPPPPVPPRVCNGQAKLLSFKKMKISADYQSDMRTLLEKHAGHLEEILARQKNLQQDMKRLLELNLAKSKTLRRAMAGDISQQDKDSQENHFENGALETCLASSSGKPVNGNGGEQLLLELHMRQAADLIYQAKITMTVIMTMIMMMMVMMMMMMAIHQAAEADENMKI